MNIRLAQLKFFNVWSFDGSNPGKNLRPEAPNWSDDHMSVGKSRTVDSICLSVSIYFKTHFWGMFFSYLPITTNYAT